MKDVLLIIFISATIVYATFAVFKTIFFKLKNVTDYINIIGVVSIFIVLSLTFKNLALVWNIIFSLIAIALCVLMIFQVFREKQIDNAYHHLSSRLVKNSPFDYFILANKDDKIIDYSESVKELFHLNDEELLNTFAFQTMIMKLNIITFNGEKFNETKAVKFNYEYRLTRTNKAPRFFELMVEENDEYYTLSFVLEPVFLNNKFIGQNIYISRNNKETLAKLESSLLETKQMIQDDRAALYCMMSMMPSVIMFYDYNSGKYLLTENACKKFNIYKREITVNEFILLIHPKDIAYYEEQSEIITSIEVTRLNYRLKIGKEFYEVNDDVMYLNKDKNLISIITLKEEEKEEEKDLVQEKTPIKVDYKEKLEDTLKVLTKMLDD